MKSTPWLIAALGIAACSEADSPTDAGAQSDSGVPSDAGISDGGLFDRGVDAGEPDAEPPDLGPEDTGVLPWGEVVVDLNLPRPPALLSEYRLVRLENGVLRYNDRVVPYELAAPLFSDYAIKERAIWVPPGTQINYRDLEAFEFPVGSAIIKSFSFAPDLRQPEVGRRVIETRVLVKYADGWQALPYLWRADGSDADYHVRGHVEMVDFVDPFGAARRATYLVPQKNQCTSCHEIIDGQGGTITTIIGPKARYLNRLELGSGAPINQLERWAALGILAGLPMLDEVPTSAQLTTYGSTVGWTAPQLERAARDYLDINCAHCHNPQAVQGVTSQLYLNVDNSDEFRLGYCKEPGSAGSGAGGRRYDIVPGHPDDSIVTYRIESERAGEMMPLLGRSLADTFGTRVIRAWIQSLPSRNCD